jgi:hypothetical protein
MNERLSVVAQEVMDTYFQDYAPADGFFRLEDFGGWIGKAHGKLADDAAKEIYKQYIAESGSGQIIFSPDWWASVDKEVKEKDGEFYVEMDFKHLGFTYDGQNSGIQELVPSGTNGNCGTFMRTTILDLWTLNGMAKNKIVWWYEAGDKIKFKTSGDCNPKKVTIYYIPTAEDENFKLPTSKAFDIATLAYNLMITAKKENPFVDDTNNANKNVTPQTETDTKQLNPVK